MGSAAFSKGDAERVAAQIDRINAVRVAAGTCRHCGGPVPCYSEFGDQRVGVRHSSRSWKAMRKRQEETDAIR